MDPIGRTGASACYRSTLPDGYVDDAQIAFRRAALTELTVTGGPKDAMGRAARKWQLRRCI